MVAKEGAKIRYEMADLRVSLIELNASLSELIAQNPQPDEGVEERPQRPDNVFDEILNIIKECMSLTNRATNDIRTEITNKVI